MISPHARTSGLRSTSVSVQLLRAQCLTKYCCYTRRIDPSTLPAARHRRYVLRCAAQGNQPSTPLVKICGVVCAEDAAHAAAAGADYIGMILWPHAKRSVDDATARDIVRAAHDGGARVVGVFVDEDADAIRARCDATGVDYAQLHGDAARAAYPALAQTAGVEIVYVVHATPEGSIVTPVPQHAENQPDWLLVDGLRGGSGEALDWTNLNVPEGFGKKGWLLAGGLRVDNVANALSIVRPAAVDVSSGVCSPDGLRKDKEKVVKFISAVKSS